MNNQVSFDSLLRMAVRETYMEQINSIPAEDKLEETLKPSVAFKKKISAIVRKETRNEKLIHFRKVAYRVAVVLMMCISLTFGSLLTAKAVRESIATTILEWHDKFTRIFIETDTPPTELPEIRFNYIPEGFELVEEESVITKSFVTHTYIQNTNYIRIKINPFDPSFIENIDNEFSKYYFVKVTDTYGIWINFNDENLLFIPKGSANFSINGTVPLEEILKIYENIDIL